MHAETENPPKGIDQDWMAVKLLAEDRSRFLCVNEPDLDSTFQELRQHSKERILADIEILDVCGAYPQRLLDLFRFRKHFLVVLRVLNILDVTHNASERFLRQK